MIETARDVGQGAKPATGIASLARLAGLPAYCALYRHADYQNPADRKWRDIDRFRVKRVWPEPEYMWRTVSPAEWARAITRHAGALGQHARSGNVRFYEESEVLQ